MSIKNKRILLLLATILIVVVLRISSHFIDYSQLGSDLLGIFINKPTCKDCNVILISLDTLSANHLPCYGYERNTAPNLCKFGKENIMFKNMFSNASWTLPSHTSIFTGLYPSQHNVNNPNKDNLASSLPFLPEILQKNGYKTYFYMQTGPSLPANRVYNRGIDVLQNIIGFIKDWDTGLNILFKNQKTKQKTFLFLHTYWVHSPYFLENRARKLYTENDEPVKLPKTFKELFTCNSKLMEYLKKSLKADLDRHYWDDQQEIIFKEIYQKIIELDQTNLSDMKAICNDKKYNDYLTTYVGHFFKDSVDTKDSKQIIYLADSYDSKIKELDDHIKDVFSLVLNSSLKENTIIMVTADHGEEFMEHGKITHGNNIYDTTLKVPLMMYIPGQKRKEIIQLTQSVDIAPTLLNVIGISKDYKFSGINIFNNSSKLLKNRYIFAEDLSYGHRIHSLRNSQWKLFYSDKDKKITPLKLYDMAKDPQEKNNLIFTNNEIVEEMLRNIPK